MGTKYPQKRKFNGETFTLMRIRKNKTVATKWADSARRPPYNAVCRVVKGKYDWLVYCGYRKRKTILKRK